MFYQCQCCGIWRSLSMTPYLAALAPAPPHRRPIVRPEPKSLKWNLRCRSAAAAPPRRRERVALLSELGRPSSIVAPTRICEQQFTKKNWRRRRPHHRRPVAAAPPSLARTRDHSEYGQRWAQCQCCGIWRSLSMTPYLAALAPAPPHRRPVVRPEPKSLKWNLRCRSAAAAPPGRRERVALLSELGRPSSIVAPTRICEQQFTKTNWRRRRPHHRRPVAAAPPSLARTRDHSEYGQRCQIPLIFPSRALRERGRAHSVSAAEFGDR